MSLDLAFRLAMQDKAIAKSLGEFISKKKVLSVKGLEPNSLRKIAEIKADKVYEMLLEDNELAIFHFEVQGKSTHRDMALRMFDYITRIISQSGNLNIRIYSVVIYINGAGANDDGYWTFGNPAIGHFEYTPLRLWEMDGDIFLDGDNVDLLTFLPQMKLSRPKEQMEKAVQRINSLEDKDHAKDLLYVLVALTQKEGLKPMIRSLMTREMMLGAPDFMRDAYIEAIEEGEERGRREGEAKGREEGEAKGREEGRKEGAEKGFWQGKIDSVLTSLRLRFQIDDFDYQSIHKNLQTMDVGMLEQSLEQSLTAKSLDDVKTWFVSLDKAAQNNQPTYKPE